MKRQPQPVMLTLDDDHDDDGRSDRERWLSYMLDLERVRLDERLIRVADMSDDDPRHLEPTVYFHVLGGQLMYIGQSTEMLYRRLTHMKTRDWDDEYVLVAPSDMRDGPIGRAWLNAVEMALVGYLKPPYNLRHWAPGPRVEFVWQHIQVNGFRLPNGVTVGTRAARLVMPNRLPRCLVR